MAAATTADPMEDLAEQAAELDGYFSDTPLEPQPNYPPLDENFDTCLVITNLPKVSQAKVEKLTKVVLKLASKIGALASNQDDDYMGVVMPFSSENQSTLGFAFVEFESKESIDKAVAHLQGYSLDKNHNLQVTPLERAMALEDTPTTDFEEPHPEPFVEKPNVTEWLEDSNQRDEFMIRQGVETTVCWYDGKNDPVVDYDGAREKEAGVQWCTYYAHWSPKGSYLATMTPNKGVVLWAGSGYEKVGRFYHPGVDRVWFSPQENYLLTSSAPSDRKGGAEPTIKVFSIQSGKLLRNFPLYPKDFKHDNYQIPPPPFQWSHDDQYLARMGDGLISIFETPSMKLLDRRSLATPGIFEFEWSPKANVIAYWAPEHSNAPAHVDLIEIPSRKQLRQKNLFNVTKCIMVWQNEGDYLAVKVTRHSKSKKSFSNNIELFRLDESNIPVEMFNTDDAVMSLSWEPRGSRFAMIHAENPESTKVSVSFYDMKKWQEKEIKGKKTKKGLKKTERVLISELNKVDTLEGKQCNCVFWSPAGQFIILASLGESASGTLEFYDVDSKTMTVKEHYRANRIAWDPAGRTVASMVTQPIGGGHYKYAMDNGYIIWSFQGKQLYQQSFEQFYQFEWRPRETLLSKTEIDTVKKNLKKYEKEFDAQDKKRQRALYLEETKGKRAERTKYRELMSRLRGIRQRQKAERVGLLDGYDSDDESNYVMKEVTVTTVLSTKEEVVI